jgi:hypothetical protein
MKKKFRRYQEKLFEDLCDPELAHPYLNEASADKIPIKARKNLQIADSIGQLFLQS